ncbi:MAG: hypothetical protein HC888_16415 [Candidatus Competibacteraceae bacterium]|nr:hypothetical protein [Candidatus Competibacteraceae bacterium]
MLDTFGEGDAGDLAIHARESVDVVGVSANGGASVIAAGVGAVATGEGGDVTIATQDLTVRRGGVILVSTFGRGDAG